MLTRFWFWYWHIGYKTTAARRQLLRWQLQPMIFSKINLNWNLFLAELSTFLENFTNINFCVIFGSSQTDRHRNSSCHIACLAKVTRHKVWIILKDIAREPHIKPSAKVTWRKDSSGMRPIIWKIRSFSIHHNPRLNRLCNKSAEKQQITCVINRK